MQCILGDNAGRDADELGISAVVEEQIVAEIFLTAGAEVTHAARRGVERHHAIARSKPLDAFACLDHRPGHLMTEQGWRYDHAGMVSTAKDLEVGTARKRCAYLDYQLSRTCLRNWNLLDSDIFTTVENCGLHGAAPVEKRVLDGPAPQTDSGFDRLATFVDHGIDGIQPHFNDRLDCVQASLDDIFDRFAAAEDRVFHSTRHQVPPNWLRHQEQVQS
jgi:hypothetical protein